MSPNQIEALIKLRAAGRSYTEISKELAIPKNTVKSYCSRKRIVLKRQQIDDAEHCRHCGQRLVQSQRCKPKRFCSNICRQSWWNSHRNQVVKRSSVALVCINCGVTFQSYGRERRKFCGHACYIKNRFSNGGRHDS